MYQNINADSDLMVSWKACKLASLLDWWLSEVE